MKGKLLWISSTILVMGATLNLYNYFTNCEYIINRYIQTNENKNKFKGEKKIIYLINNVNSYCRTFSKYDRLKKEKNVEIIFFVAKDFSNNDIDNLRNAFGIPHKNAIERIDNRWEKIFKKCNSNKKFLYNFLIIINEARKLDEIRKF